MMLKHRPAQEPVPQIACARYANFGVAPLILLSQDKRMQAQPTFVEDKAQSYPHRPARQNAGMKAKGQIPDCQDALDLSDSSCVVFCGSLKIILQSVAFS